jgi:hypothetical protein
MLTMAAEGGGMNAHLLLLLGSLFAGSPSEPVERKLSVTAFDRVRVDGPFKVKLMTGVTPFATVRGSAGAVDMVSVAVQGRTLVVRPNPSSWGGYPGQAAGPVDIAVGTQELSAAWVNGAGTLAIDKVKGLSFELALQGSGSSSIAQAQVDQLKIAISGVGTATLAGTAAKLTSIVRGSSTLDATGLDVKDAAIGAEGPSLVRVRVTNAVKVDARGTATVELSGSPACTTTAQGSATVTGCR